MRIWGASDTIPKALQAGIGGFVSGNTFQNRDFSISMEVIYHVLSSQDTSLIIIRAYEGSRADSSRLSRVFIDPGIYNDDRDVCLIRPGDGGDDFPGAAGGDAQHIDLSLNEVFDDLHLSFHIQFAIGSLNDHVDLMLAGGFLRSLLHADKEGVIHGFHDEGDAGFSTFGSLFTTVALNQTQGNTKANAVDLYFHDIILSSRKVISGRNPAGQR